MRFLGFETGEMVTVFLTESQHSVTGVITLVDVIGLRLQVTEVVFGGVRGQYDGDMGIPWTGIAFVAYAADQEA